MLLRVILGTTQRQDVRISGGLSKLNGHLIAYRKNKQPFWRHPGPYLPSGPLPPAGAAHTKAERGGARLWLVLAGGRGRGARRRGPLEGRGAEQADSQRGWHMRSRGRHSVTARTAPTRPRSLGHPIARYLAGTGRCDGGWVCRKFQMAEDLADDLALRDDGDEPQHPALAKGTRSHIQVKHPLEQPRPAPARRRGVRLLVHLSFSEVGCSHVRSSLQQ